MIKRKKNLIDKLFYHESWNIVIAKSRHKHIFPANTLETLTKSRLHQLEKKYTFQADPFIFEKNNQLYVFYESFNFRDSKGVLHCRVLNKNLIELDDIKLEGFDNLKCHLSYPYIFQGDDQELLMVPESSERKEVILFKCVDFPKYWEKVAVLISGQALTDNRFFSVNEKKYMISTSPDNEIVIHTADKLCGPWVNISPSLSVCNRHHRGAGGTYQIDEKTYILTQECTPDVYGKSVYVKELKILNKVNYAERLIANISPSINNSSGIHTLNFTENFISFDTKENIFHLAAAFKKILFKYKQMRRKNKLQNPKCK